MGRRHEFTVEGEHIRATVAQVKKALRRVEPEQVRRHAVVIGGVRYPVVQAFAVAFGIDRRHAYSPKARRVFRQMGFDVSSNPTDERSQRQRGSDLPESRPSSPVPGAGVRPRFPRANGLPRPERKEVDPEYGRPVAQVQTLDVPPIVLRWSAWHPWDSLRRDERRRTAALLPAGRSGVYQVMVKDRQGMLTIGRASDLRARVKYQLVMGHGVHPVRDRICETEDTSRVLVRWALTDWPAAAEEALHKQHVRQHGRLPKHTQRT